MKQNITNQVVLSHAWMTMPVRFLCSSPTKTCPALVHCSPVPLPGAALPSPLLRVPHDWDTTSIFCRSWLPTSSLIHNYKIPSKSHSHLICKTSSLSILETSGSDFYAFMLDLIFINAKWTLHEALLSHIKGMMPVSIHLVAKYQEIL